MAFARDAVAANSIRIRWQSKLKNAARKSLSRKLDPTPFRSASVRIRCNRPKYMHSRIELANNWHSNAYSRRIASLEARARSLGASNGPNSSC